MGEYAYFNGERIKIGTCESMYYLRWDQRHLVTDSETDLYDPQTLAVIRFRFPFPDEDSVAPGHFEPYERPLRLDGFELPEGIEHYSCQFKATNGNGYLVSLPCPESAAEVPYKIHRNGYGGPAKLVEQGLRDGQLVGVAECGGCGARFRLQDGYEEAAAVALRSKADRQNEQDEGSGARLHTIADRLLAGYGPAFA